MILQHSRPLMKLMSAFNISKDDDKMCFDAFVEYVYDGKQLNIQSKVVVVSPEQGTHDMLFLLNVKLIAMQLPEAFRSDKDYFSYTFGSVMITGMDKAAKKYILVIRPVALHN
jgi:hypothetical protein